MADHVEELGEGAEYVAAQDTAPVDELDQEVFLLHHESERGNPERVPHAEDEVPSCRGDLCPMCSHRCLPFIAAAYRPRWILTDCKAHVNWTVKRSAGSVARACGQPGRVPAVARPEVRTSALAAAIGVSRQTLATWVTRELLPQPRRLHLGAHGSSSRFPGYSVELGQYVRQALRESPFVEVAREVAPLLARDADWVDEQLTAGKPIKDLLRELGAPRT